ncbi:unnamed protein product [Amoebophrya sp. A25]|nr:unnamed protein product [Amoebophrya sp. A25]|eukprot:GSA25T00007775001.1
MLRACQFLFVSSWSNPTFGQHDDEEGDEGALEDDALAENKAEDGRRERDDQDAEFRPNKGKTHSQLAKATSPAPQRATTYPVFHVCGGLGCATSWAWSASGLYEIARDSRLLLSAHPGIAVAALLSTALAVRGAAVLDEFLFPQIEEEVGTSSSRNQKILANNDSTQVEEGVLADAPNKETTSSTSETSRSQKSAALGSPKKGEVEEKHRNKAAQHTSVKIDYMRHMLDRFDEREYAFLFYLLAASLPASWYAAAFASSSCLLPVGQNFVIPFQLVLPGILGSAAMFEKWHKAILFGQQHRESLVSMKHPNVKAKIETTQRTPLIQQLGREFAAPTSIEERTAVSPSSSNDDSCHADSSKMLNRQELLSVSTTVCATSTQASSPDDSQVSLEENSRSRSGDLLQHEEQEDRDEGTSGPGVKPTAEVLVVAESASSWTMKGQSQGNSEELQSQDVWETLRWGKSHIVSYFSDAPGAAQFLALQACSMGFSLFVDYSMTQWRGAFFDTFQTKNVKKFKVLLQSFGVIATTNVVANAYADYMTSLWDLHSREFLTHRFTERAWFRNAAFYKMKVEAPELGNCDQRIHEDVQAFVSGSRGLTLGFADAVMRLCFFFPQLVYHSPSGLWELCLVMSVVSSVLTHQLGQDLVPANMAIQDAEAGFRNGLISVRDRAEALALSGSGDGGLLRRRFDEIKIALWNSMQIGFRLQAFTAGYGLCAGILPFLLLAPSFFSGSITMGAMFQLESILGQVQGSLDFFMSTYGDFASWRVTTDRLIALDKFADAASARPKLMIEDAERMRNACSPSASSRFEDACQRINKRQEKHCGFDIFFHTIRFRPDSATSTGGAVANSDGAKAGPIPQPLAEEEVFNDSRVRDPTTRETIEALLDSCIRSVARTVIQLEERPSLYAPDGATSSAIKWHRLDLAEHFYSSRSRIDHGHYGINYSVPMTGTSPASSFSSRPGECFEDRTLQREDRASKRQLSESAGTCLKNLHFSLQPSQRLLVSGDAAQGKSVLVRCLARVWPERLITADFTCRPESVHFVSETSCVAALMGENHLTLFEALTLGIRIAPNETHEQETSYPSPRISRSIHETAPPGFQNNLLTSASIPFAPTITLRAQVEGPEHRDEGNQVESDPATKNLRRSHPTSAALEQLCTAALSDAGLTDCICLLHERSHEGGSRHLTGEVRARLVFAQLFVMLEFRQYLLVDDFSAKLGLPEAATQQLLQKLADKLSKEHALALFVRRGQHIEDILCF